MLCGFFARLSVFEPRSAWLLGAAVACGAALPAAAAEPAATPKPAAEKKDAEEPKRLELETSDGVKIAAWCYPQPEDAPGVGTVLLVHDLGGSHRTVEPLALALQKAEYTVVAPDLRGHGESPLNTIPLAGAEANQAKSLKKGDFEAMAATSGGKVRSQAGVIGDLESVYHWIVTEAEKGTLAKQPLFVVGSGLGGTVAATWVAADATWPPIVSGPQGGLITGLVLVSPVYATRGFSLAPALGSEAIRRTLPLLIIDGGPDRDGAKVFDQLKRQRPKNWFDSRQPAEDRVPGAVKPSLYLLKSPLDSTADELATHRSADPRQAAADPAALIVGFMATAARAGR